MDILFLIMFYINVLPHDEETLDSFIPPSYLRYKNGPDFNLLPVHSL